MFCSFQGTASTLTRAEVRGGGKKPYAQKGTGGARRGSSTSPLFPGGGVVFGPKVGQACGIAREHVPCVHAFALATSAMGPFPQVPNHVVSHIGLLPVHGQFPYRHTTGYSKGV